ncbi:MAG: S9 family peptidase [Dethiosulfovibrio sp.]|nr:S9 family peptidase [Dethiosulfovibrio sp.]
MADRAKITKEDLLKFKFLGNPKISKTGGHVCFSLATMDRENNRYSTNLWIHNLNEGNSYQLTSSGKEKCFCWTADGSEVAFSSGRNDPPKGGSELFTIPLSGGEARSIGKLDISVSSIIHLGGDEYLLSATDPRQEELLEGADYMVFSQVPFCSNGKGYTAQSRTGLYLYRIGENPEKLTPDTLDVERFRLSPDGTKALITGKDYSDVKPIFSELWELDLRSKRMEPLISGDGFDCRCADYLDDKVVLSGSDLSKHGINQNASLFSLENGVLREITPGLDAGLRNSIGCDCRYGTSDMNLAFFVDDHRIWFVSTDRTRSNLHSVGLDGEIKLITNDLSSVDDYHVHQGRIALVGLKGLELQELYTIEDGKERSLTDFNSWMIRDRELSQPEYLESHADPAWDIDGWVMRPVDFIEGKTYPTIIHVHGGPKTAFGDVFFHEMQLWAAKGYVVAFCNPRGSDGRGNDFDDIRGKYGTIDYDDIMAFTDAVSKLPYVDSTRMGITGGSYGGYMTNWVIGHTDRFKAAVSQRSISNWISKAGISDIGYYFVPDQQGADIWDDVEKLWWHSPLKYADQASTPTLFIHSDEDYRCELSQGLQMFTALKRHGVESKICVFKGENHELSRGGKPKERLARLEEICRWFDEHLKK